MARKNNNDLFEGTKRITCEQLAQALDLQVVSMGRGEMYIKSISVSRPGLQLSGYFNHFAKERVQVIGNAEHEYLNYLPQTAKESNLEMLFSKGIPCIIIARGLDVDKDLLQLAQKYECPVFSSKAVTAVLVHDIIVYFTDLLAPTTVMHGVLLDISGIGVLITGNAGIGKSETALELISRGHRLVADDAVVIKNINDGLHGRSPEKIQHFMEVRGIGIVNIRTMFGSGAVRPEKTIELIVELVPWDENMEYDRLGDEVMTTEILGIDIQKLVIPVSPGRNVPIIIETAARKFRLEEFGYSALDDLMRNQTKKS